MSTAQRHTVGMTPKKQLGDLGECSEAQKLSFCGRRVGPKLKKLGFFQDGEYGELAIKKSE